ncbi:MAG TPA: zinc ribbon domain-containing protein [Blastocatellia bacterium]|nr:zinc ribbon domain-containing protein [Blastocatellia bacterium]
MYCPKCSSQAVEGQRYCRQCGTNLGVILDAMDGKTVTVDFETLKKDLRQLGQSLRSSFEEVHQEFKKNKRHNRQWRKGDWNWVSGVAQTAAGAGAAAATEAVSAVHTAAPAISTKPIPIKIKQVRGGSSRQQSFQQAALSIFGGGAATWALYYLLHTAGQSGLLWNLEQLILRESGAPLYGLAPVFQALWVLGLIPVAKGVAHLLNGTFFASKPTENPADQVVQEINARLAAAQAAQIPQAQLAWAAPAASPAIQAEPERAPDTSELKRERSFSPVGSITEDPTERFDAREPDRVRSSS